MPATKPQPERALKPSDIARRWGIHVRVVLSWIDNGELPAHNVATTPDVKRWKILPEDLARFEAARAAVPAPPPAVTRRRRAEKPPGYKTYY